MEKKDDKVTNKKCKKMIKLGKNIVNGKAVQAAHGAYKVNTVSEDELIGCAQKTGKKAAKKATRAVTFYYN